MHSIFVTKLRVPVYTCSTTGFSFSVLQLGVQRNNATTHHQQHKHCDNATTRNDAQQRNDATTQRRNDATTQRRNDATTQRRTQHS